MQDVTLALLVKDGSVYLGMKKRGFGKGWWNGFGGKVEDETLLECMLRETHDESSVTPTAYTKVGEVEFFFPDRPDWNQRMHCWLVNEWEGSLRETEEMRPKRFLVDELPFDRMWPADRVFSLSCFVASSSRRLLPSSERAMASSPWRWPGLSA